MAPRMKPGMTMWISFVVCVLVIVSASAEWVALLRDEPWLQGVGGVAISAAVLLLLADRLDWRRRP